MENHRFGRYQAELNPETTRNWYAKYDGWGCSCGHCRNFLKLAREKELPKYITEILEVLGISPEKATYVGELFTDHAGIHYQFSYRIAGVFQEGPDQTGNLKEVRCCHEPYPYGAPDFPVPHFDLEFYATLPWVLNDA